MTTGAEGPKDQRIALVDHDAHEVAYALGDQISFLEMRTTISQQRLIGFQINPSRATSNTGTGARTENESGIVTEVLSAEIDGYRYRAYVVQGHEGELLLPDQSATTDYRVGDTVSFAARHLQALSLPHLVRFELPAASGAAPDFSAGTIGSLATKTVPANVKQILSGNVDGDRFNAYIVDWNGQRVGVTDEFATTHFVVGQHIALPVSRIDAGGSKRLLLAMFNFPKHVPELASTCQSNE